MRWVATLCVLSALAVGGCTKRGTVADSVSGEPGDYYPLALGNRWTYEVSFLGQKNQDTVEIVGQREGFWIDSKGAQLKVDAFGLRDDKRYLLQAPVKAGTTWKNVVSVSSTEHYQIASAGEPCTVPAGSFDNCVAVEGRNRIDEQKTLVNRIVFARGVGIVRIDVSVEQGQQHIPQTELVLASYALAGAPAK